MHSISSCLIHIVRRFGCVGGMERYVWELTHRLVEHDLEVIVVCEEVFGTPHSGIKIIKVDRSPPRPRWRSMVRFRAKVEELVRSKLCGRIAIIHSHERSISHQVTTFHGPPIDSSGSHRLKAFLSRRIRAWQSLERDELLADGVQKILPVSSAIGRQLMNSYPGLAMDKISVARPGVSAPDNLTFGREHERLTLLNNGVIRFGFVGVEWKRKGLDLAVAFVDRYVKLTTVPACLHVYGPDASTLPKKIRSADFVKIHGWITDIPWQEIDVLLHLARVEPFGMVVAEARRAGVPVVISGNVGVAELGFMGVEVVTSLADLPEAVASLISRPSSFMPEVRWTWSDLAEFHINHVYPSVIPMRI